MGISVATLQTQLEKIRNLAEKREDQFSEKSERWQESETGQDFEMKTQELDGICEDLENVIDAIEEWNND